MAFAGGLGADFRQHAGEDLGSRVFLIAQAMSPALETDVAKAERILREGKKDLMSAGMYCYLAFRLWLRAGEWVPGIKTENRALFSMQ